MTTRPVPASMLALRAHQRGGPELLVVEEVPTPRPGPGEVLVAVQAAAITFDELRWDETWSHLPTTPSHEWSGAVAALGSGAARGSGLTVGDKVFGMVAFDRDGAAAEYVVVPTGLVAPKPRSLTHVEAAALPLAGLTAQQALMDHGRVRTGDEVLVLGAAGGVGALAVQLALRLGARVSATAFAKDLDYVAGLGALLVHSAEELERVPLTTASYDLVLDTVGGPGMRDAIALARRGGRYVSLQEPAPADRLAELGVNGTFFVVRPDLESLRRLGSQVDAGHLRVTIAASYLLDQGRAAFESGIRSGRLPGKTVLVVRGGPTTSDDVRG